MATCIFKYRSRSTCTPVELLTLKFTDERAEDLQVEGIIPRSPSPIPLEDRNPEDLSPEEARELVRRMRAREQDQVKVKREKRSHTDSFEEGEDGDEDDITISEVRSSKRRRGDRDSGVEIIDLTEE